MRADRYTGTAIALHWAIAFLIIGQLLTGLMIGYDLAPKPSMFKIFQFHKSLGLTILVLSFLRLLWRLTHKAPLLPDHMPLWEKLAARASHYAFYVFIIGVPLSGWLLVSTSPMNFPTLWFDLFEWPHIPGFETMNGDRKTQVNGIAEISHVYLAYSLLGLLILHIAAALKHQFIDKDNVMHHMIPWIKPKLPLSLLLLALLPFPASAATWEVDHLKSSISFSGENAGEKFDGKFLEWEAKIDFDPKQPDPSAVLVTIKTGSAKTLTLTYNATLPKEEWFDSKTYPDAVFESHEIKALGGDKYEAKGKLTIKNVSRDIVLPLTLAIDGDHAVMTANTKIDRLAYDVGKKSDPQAEWVSKDIGLQIRLEADEK